MNKKQLLRPSIALPSDHGSWVFLLSPLLIGFFSSGHWQPRSLSLILAALAAFFLRQPAEIMIKAYSGRRSRLDLPAARFWFSVYASVALIALGFLVRHGFGYLAYLAVPGLIVFAWHLLLIRNRAERYKIGIDVIASGALALAAPGAYWLGVGHYEPMGWLLWLLVWLQSAASIVYAFLRLAQRKLKNHPPTPTRLRMARRALLYSGVNLVFSVALGLAGIVSAFLWLAYAVQFAECIYGTFKPAVGVKPTHIGIRQLIVSTLFTILFILTW